MEDSTVNKLLDIIIYLYLFYDFVCNEGIVDDDVVMEIKAQMDDFIITEEKNFIQHEDLIRKLSNIKITRRDFINKMSNNEG